jgi:hypothetical protein
LSLLEQVEDWLLTEAETTVRGYARRMETDLEQYARSLIARMLKTVALGMAGIAFPITGTIFLLLGSVTYLSGVVTPPLAWGIVGLVAGSCGALLLLLARR